MRWNKRGLVFNPHAASEFVFTHCQCPVALDLEDKIRIFFGSRTSEGCGAMYYIDVDSEDPQKILHIQDVPLLGRGLPGTFDQDGILQTCIKRVGNEIYMYFGGFARMVTSPHLCMIGLATSKDGGESFQKMSDGPIFPISRIDPYLVGSLDVVFHENIWHMIYTSGTNCFIIDNKFEQSYALKHAVSEDGIDWRPTNFAVIPRQTQYDAHCRPAIVKVDDTFHMYFSARKVFNYRVRGENAYRLGYATSDDLIHWREADEEGGIQASNDGWDSEMICYPNIIESKGRVLMFYNGNEFGKTGFGVAELVEC